MKNKFFLIALIVSGATTLARADEDNKAYKLRGYLSAKLSVYTHENQSRTGKLSRSQLEGATDLTSDLTLVNQVRMNLNSLNSDLSSRTTTAATDDFELYAGENFLKFKSEGFVVQAGYQEVIWGEAFGLNYADIVSPKDQRATLYSDAADARRPLLLLNVKKFFSTGEFSGSLQGLYSPEPRFSKTLPLEVYTGDLLSNFTLEVQKEKTPDLFKKHEWGAKLSGSYSGLDASMYFYSYLSRDPNYELRSLALNKIAVREVHAPVKSYGLSFAKTIYDFVLRSDLVRTLNHRENALSPLTGLISYETNMTNTLISIDSPTYHDFSGVLIVAHSGLSETRPSSFREKDEDYIIAKIARNFSGDKTADLSYTHEINKNGRSVQTQFTWPFNNVTDIKMGGEFYFGEGGSNLHKLKNNSSVFVALKNYFQL